VAILQERSTDATGAGGGGIDKDGGAAAEGVARAEVCKSTSRRRRTHLSISPAPVTMRLRSSYSIFATVAYNFCYQISGEVLNKLWRMSLVIAILL
jgi:hypothetical protein